ncbi:MAG: DNA recombination protein RmuC [Caulobacteraceae bacterium]|nr:DNA recombination protein RmuC [Caulobacteraceae bacterium]
MALSGYLDAVEATDDAARELHLKKHLAELKSHVKNLASKEYQKHVPDTAGFRRSVCPRRELPGRCGRTRPEPLRRCVCAKGHSHHADDDGRAGEIHRLRLASRRQRQELAEDRGAWPRDAWPNGNHGR